MEITLKFWLKDKAFLFLEDKVYPCTIEEIEWSQNEEGITQLYTVCYEKTNWLFDTSKHTYVTSAEKVFLTKAEAKEYVEKLEEARELIYSNREEEVTGCCVDSIKYPTYNRFI